MRLAGRELHLAQLQALGLSVRVLAESKQAAALHVPIHLALSSHHRRKKGSIMSQTVKAGVTSYRYVKFVGDNYERASWVEADCIGEYVTDAEGLPQHVRDWPLKMETQLPVEDVEVAR